MHQSVRRISFFIYLVAIALPSASTTYQAVGAQGPLQLQIPNAGLSIPGVAQRSPISAPAFSSSLYADFGTAEALTMQFKDAVPHTRGSHDVILFREDAPSVVLIRTNDALGSGSLLGDNVILTNFHVVDHNREVTIVFKPTDPSGRPSQDEVAKADVIKIDVQRDLALLRPHSLPSRTVRPLQISSNDIEVGADVAAIGHPSGLEWTFTKGIVSSVRPDFEWTTGPGIRHRATVVQTQTPINPGNSGGPLLSDDGKLVGVNSFNKKDAEGLNFAVAAKEIRFFLKNQTDGLITLNSCDQATTVFEGRNAGDAAYLRMISLRCDDKADITIIAPDDKTKPIYALVDMKRRGKPEGIVFDVGRTGKWNDSYWDTNLDGIFPLRGLHPDGNLVPTRFEPRCGPKKPLTNFRCA